MAREDVTQRRILRNVASSHRLRVLIFLILLDPVVYFLAAFPPLLLVRYLWSANLAAQAAVIIAAFFLFPLCAVLALICISHVFGRRFPEGTFRMSDPAAEAWLRNVAIASVPRRSFFAHLVTGFSFMGPLFLRGLGAHIGKRVLIGTHAHIADPSLTEIGDDSIIGDSVFVSGHAIEGDWVTIGRVCIGCGVTIGANSFISPGTRIDDGAIVATGAVVRKGTHIRAGEVWGGVPAKKITTVTNGSKDDHAPGPTRSIHADTLMRQIS